jgi:hypothetical protein
MQDLAHTERVIEASFQGMSFDKLLNASGKEDLGGGVLVGITVAHQDTLVAFEGRFTPAETSTITTASSAPVSGTVRLIDNTALFETNNVQRGSAYINFDDRSVGDVVEVISETELRVTTPVNGDVNDFGIGDRYDVYNIAQCFATGGNLTAVDTIGGTISPILPTWGTQIVITSSSSATLQELAEIRFAAYQDEVHVDLLSSNSGTDYPIGTPLTPVNNFADALTIAADVGLSAFHIIGNATIPLVLDFAGLTFHGDSKAKTTLTILDGSLLNGCEFEDCKMTGTFTAGDVVELRDCEIDDLLNIAGGLYDCGMEGTNALQDTLKTECVRGYSEVAGGGSVNILYINDGKFLMRDYHGGIELRGKDGTQPVSIDMSSGQVLINDDNTAGEITLRGIAKWSNKGTYAGTTTIVDELISAIEFKEVHGQIQRSIFINTEAVVNGNGYQQTPFNNLTDAVDAAEAANIFLLTILADVTLDRQMKNFVFYGIGDPTIDVNNQNIDKSEFRDVHLTGDIGTGSIHGHNIELEHGLTGLQGDFFTCGLAGTVTLAAGSNTTMVDGYSTIGGLTQPTLDINGGGANVSVRSYRGGLQVAGINNAADAITVSMAQGKVTLSASNTAGTLSLRGLAQLTDNSAGTTVDKTALLQPSKLLTIAKFIGLQ